MAIQYRKKVAKLADVVGVEEAEGLFAWLLSNPKGQVDLSRCTHLHAANLQVIMAVRPDIAAWPDDTAFAAWLETATHPH